MHFDHFIIRLINKNDVSAFSELIQKNKSRIQTYMPVTVKTVFDELSAAAYINQRISEEEKKESFFFLIQDTDNNRLTGALFLKKIDWEHPKCELGYFIDGDYEGKGITAKALSLVKDHCFQKLKLNKLFLRIAPENKASKRVAEKSGFVLEALLRNDFTTKDGNLMDVEYYGCLNPGA